MRICFTETAVDEVDEILSYISQHNPSAAENVAEAMIEAVAQVAARPLSAPIVYTGGVHAKLVGRFQYRIYYEVRGDELIIRNVRSTRRQRPWEESGT